MGNVVSFLDHKFAKQALTYTVIVRHLSEADFEIEVLDVAGDSRSRLAVAADLRRAAAIIEEAHAGSSSLG